MSARREAQSSMPGLAEPRESGRSVFGPSLTPPPRPINVAAAIFMPIPADVAPRGDGHDVHIHGGSFYEAQNIVVNQQHYYPDTTSAHAGASAFPDPIGVLSRWTNEALRVSPQSISSQRTPETGKIFQSRTQFRSWWEVVNSVLWASGIPGAGKTFLASAIFDDINNIVRTSPQDACTIIYLKHNDQWTTWDIVSFIIIDLVESKPLPPALEAIWETLRKQRSMNERPSLPDLVALLQNVVKLYRRCFILIDGLDEMKAEIQVEVIRVIAGLEANVLLTSRPLQLVQDQLKQISHIKPVFTTVTAEDEDLKLYIEDTINRTPTFASLLDDSYPKEQLIQKIQTNADGMFLHAMLQMEALRHCINQEELLELLDRFPPGILDMYVETMKRIERQHPSHVAFAKTALLWLVHANGAMSIDDLQCATATVAPDYRVEPKRMLTENNLLTICCGLVTVDAETRQARLIHDTAREALRSLLSEHCPKPQAMVARACITRLVEFEFHQSSVTDKDELQAMYAKAPLLRYAHLAVQHHVRKGVEEDPPLISRVDQFVRQCTSYPYPDPFVGGGVHGLTALHVAVAFNQHLIVDKLLDEGGDVNKMTNNRLGGISPLAIATLEGFDSLAKYLLTVLDIHTSDGKLPPLMCAAMRGRDTIVEQLLSHFERVAKEQGDQGPAGVGKGVNCPGRFGITALAFASLRGDAAVVKLLLGVEGVDISKCGARGWTPLLNACQEGHAEVVKLLLSTPGIHVNQALNDGASPLFIASQNGRVEVVKLLLSARGIDVNQATDDGASPLFVASQNGHIEVVKLLLGAPGIDVNHAANDGASPLFVASQNGQVEVVKLLLAAPGIHINQAKNDGASPLFVVSQDGQVEVAKLLLGAPGIDVNQAASDGAPPLLIASQHNHVKVVKLLLSAPGIDVNQADNNGFSSLFLASQNGHVEVVKVLLNAAGIDVNQAMNNGASPLWQASWQGHVEVVKLLLSAPGIHVNQQTNKRVSPLITAAYNGHEDVVKVLLDVPGINITHEDSFGDTALTAASSKGHEEIVQLLTAALDREAASLDPTSESNTSSNHNPQVGQLSPMVASPHAPLPAHQPLPSPSQLVNTIPDVAEIGGTLPQATRSHSPRPPSPSLGPLPNTMRNRHRQGTRSPSPPAASTSEQDERMPKRPRIGESETGTTNGGGQEPRLDSLSTSEHAGPLPPTPVPPLVNPPAPPLHQASTSHPPTTASLLLDPPQDETTRKRKRHPPGSRSDLDASHDERPRKRRRLT